MNTLDVVLQEKKNCFVVSPPKKKVGDKMKNQMDEIKKQHGKVKALVDRIAVEIAIQQSSCSGW